MKISTATATPKAPNAAQKAFLHLWEWLTGTSETLWNFLFPVIVSDVGKTIQALEPLALQIVLSLATSSKSGAEKRADAVNQLTASAITAGIQTGADVINTTVELALQNLKATGSLAK